MNLLWTTPNPENNQMTSGFFQREIDLEDYCFKFITPTEVRSKTQAAFTGLDSIKTPLPWCCVLTVALKYQTNDKVRYHLGFLLFSYSQYILPIWMAHMWIPWGMMDGGRCYCIDIQNCRMKTDSSLLLPSWMSMHATDNSLQSALTSHIQHPWAGNNSSVFAIRTKKRV